jgi:hypothetical protein
MLGVFGSAGGSASNCDCLAVPPKQWQATAKAQHACKPRHDIAMMQIRPTTICAHLRTLPSIVQFKKPTITHLIAKAIRITIARYSSRFKKLNRYK